MKKVLLGTSALLGVGLLAGTAQASDGVKLSLGGYITNQFGAAFDDDSNGELGDNINAVGVGTDAEIYFLGSVTLDNGITVGARFDLEGGDEDGDQIDQAYAYFKGGFGDIRIGSQAGAAGNMYMLPPGSTANFGPYSPNTTGSAVSPGLFDPEGAIANQDKSQKLVYYSPNWGGFSFGVSYTPDDNEKDYNGGDNADGSFRATATDGNNNSQNNFGVGVHYDLEGDGWGLSMGGAAYFEGDIQEKADGDDEAQGYNAGINATFGGLTIGVAGTYFNDAQGKGNDAWGVATGLSYNVDAWTVGAGYAYSEQEGFLFGDALTGGDDITVQRAGVTGSYAMGPGIDLDAGIFYTWTGGSADEVDGADADYDSIEFSVGSSIKF
jgi:predicted porin